MFQQELLQHAAVAVVPQVFSARILSAVTGIRVAAAVAFRMFRSFFWLFFFWGGVLRVWRRRAVVVVVVLAEKKG